MESAPASSVGSRFGGWVKSSLGVVNYLISVLTPSCIFNIYSMILSISTLFSELSVEFLRNSTYSELSSFVLELSAIVTSLSLSAASYWSAPWPSIGQECFENQLPLPMAFVVVFLGAIVLVGAWTMGAETALVGGSVFHVFSVGTAGGIFGSYELKMTCQTSRAASFPPQVFPPPLVSVFEIVRNLRLALGIGGWMV